MRLTALSLSHFRSHRRTTLALDGRIVVIHGANGAGKTNLLEAVSLLSPGRGLRRAPAAELMRRPETLGWRIDATLDGHEIALRTEAAGPRAVRIDGKAATQAALGTLARMVWLVPAMDRLWIEGAEGRRRFVDRMTLSFAPEHGEAVLDYEKAMRQRNRLLRDDVREPAWFAALEGQMVQAGLRIEAARLETIRRVAEAQTPDAVFPAADLAIIDPDGPALAAEALAAGRRRDAAAGRTLIGPHRSDLAATYRAKGVDASMCSTGEQKALLISLILANARALKAELGAAPILLLDEVAAHLDAGRRDALYEALTELGAQAFLTGTGPELFDALEGRAQRLEVHERDGESSVTDHTD